MRHLERMSILRQFRSAEGHVQMPGVFAEFERGIIVVP
jgi:hypothetical protein